MSVPIPNIISGQAIGTTITVQTSADLAQLNIQGLAVGSQVWNVAANAYFALTESDAALEPDSVVAVLGITGLRWVVVQAGSGPWQNLNVQYVSPTGNDSNDGSGWPTAKLTIYAGINELRSAGGGTVYVADMSEVGGPVPGQGIRLRADNMPGQGYFFDAPGFLPCIIPLRIIGVGAGTPNYVPFTPLTPANIIGGGARNDPALWVVGCNQMPGLVVENLQQYNAPLSSQIGARIGVDFDRNVDGTIRDIAVTQAVRVGTSTTYTLTLPPGFSVNSASRTSNVTTLRITNPGLPWFPWRGTIWSGSPGPYSVPIRFTSGSGSFASGDYFLSGNSNIFQDNVNWTLSYPDAGPDIANTPISGTVQTHGMCTGELLDLTTASVNFFGTQYFVESVTVDTVTVTDPFDTTGNQTEFNIGTLAHQERFYCGTTNCRFDNVCVAVTQNIAGAGPSWDIGSASALAPKISFGYMGGYYGFGTPKRDERRMAAMYVYPGTAGNLGPPSGSASVYDTSGSGGSIFFETPPSGTLFADVRRVIVEQTSGLPLPAVRCDGNSSSSVYIADTYNADGVNGAPCVVLNNIPVSGAVIERCGFGPVQGSCSGAQWFLQPATWITTEAGGAPSPWTVGQITPWADDGRISGRHPGGPRALGTLTSRFQNTLLPPASWTPLTGVTLTATGLPAPDGSNTAAQLVTTVENFTTLRTGGDGNTWAVGGRFYMCGWVNLSASSAMLPTGLFQIALAGATFGQGAVVNVQVGYSGTGWQFFSAIFPVVTCASSTPSISIQALTPPGTVQLWGLTSGYIPDTVRDNDAYEFVGTARHQPVYLPPGMTGTMEGQKLIGHGGLGTAARYTVGGGAGQITIGAAAAQAIEVFDEAGNSLGVLRPSAFTVN